MSANCVTRYAPNVTTYDDTIIIGVYACTSVDFAPYERNIIVETHDVPWTMMQVQVDEHDSINTRTVHDRTRAVSADAPYTTVASGGGIALKDERLCVAWRPIRSKA